MNDSPTHIDRALAAGAGRLTESLGDAYYAKRLVPSDSPQDANPANHLVREAARRFGAARVGFCALPHPLPAEWLVPNRLQADLAGLNAAIVLLIPMDPNQIRRSPPAAVAETRLGYARMAFCAAATAEFVRARGHQALPCGNDTTLSVPLAIQAGLGRRGRHGLLIAPGLGPFVRICKVFTDMPLTPDPSQSDRPAACCTTCTLCAAACPAKAITPATDTLGRLAPVNAQACTAYWQAGHTGCALCQAACPHPA